MWLLLPLPPGCGGTSQLSNMELEVCRAGTGSEQVEWTTGTGWLQCNDRQQVYSLAPINLQILLPTQLREPQSLAELKQGWSFTGSERAQGYGKAKVLRLGTCW